MTDEQEYAELLKELGRVIAEKNDAIRLNYWHTADLKKKLAAAEEEIIMLKKEKSIKE